MVVSREVVLRTVFLAGLDPRIKAAFCVGWMSTMNSIPPKSYPWTWTCDVHFRDFNKLLDIPDVISLRAPSPLLVQYDIEDRLFSLEGQKEADGKISSIYAKMGNP